MTTLPCAYQGHTNPDTAKMLTLLWIGVMFSSFLIPLAVVLFFSSSASSRWHPVFVLNVCAIALGILYECLYYDVLTTNLVMQTVPPVQSIAAAGMSILIPICIQSILLLRVAAIYPWKRLSLLRLVAIYVPVAALKTARLANAGVAIWNIHKESSACTDPMFVAQQVWRSPFTKVEWFMQLVDNAFVAILFLLPLCKTRKGQGVQPSPKITFTPTSSTTSWSASGQVKGIFWIAISNFLFPVLYNIIQVVALFVEPDIFHGAYIFTINIYVSIIGVLFTTIYIGQEGFIGRTANGEAQTCSSRK